MSRYKIYEQHGLNYLTLTTVGWIDVFTPCWRRVLVKQSAFKTTCTTAKQARLASNCVALRTINGVSDARQILL